MYFPNSISFSLAEIKYTYIDPIKKLDTVLNKLKNEKLSAFDLLDAYKIIKKFELIHETDPEFLSEEGIDPISIKKVKEISSEIFRLLSNIVPKPLPAQPSQDEIHAFLTEEGILPTPEEAKNIFFSLGDDWWKQIIDYDCHHHGKWVFDKGLHGGTVEPGFFDGIEKASHLFCDNFNLKFDLELYHKIHHAACQHFNGKSNGTRCESHEIDKFRNVARMSYASIPIQKSYSSLFYQISQLQLLIKSNNDLLQEAKEENPSSCEEVLEDNKLEQNSYLEEMLENYKSIMPKKFHEMTSDENLSKTLAELEAELKAIAVCKDFADKMNREIAKVEKRLSIRGAFVCYTETEKDARIDYMEQISSSFCENTAKKCFDLFNESLCELQRDIFQRIPHTISKESLLTRIALKKEYQNRVVPLIGQLFQELDWLHPYFDGQGRTDLISLQGSLSKEGVHPALLQQPYFSSSSALDEWIDYLQSSLKGFEQHFRINLIYKKKG